MKVNTHLLALLFTLIKADSHIYSFLIVTIDFIIDLLELNRYNALYVVVDYDLTKAIVLISCIKIINTIGIARFYHNNIYRRFEFPNRIILDRELQFSSQVFQEMNKQLGVTLSISTAFYL